MRERSHAIWLHFISWDAPEMWRNVKYISQLMKYCIPFILKNLPYNIIAMDNRINQVIKLKFTVQWRWERYSDYFYDFFLFLQVFHLSAFWFASIGIIGVFFNIVAICVILLTEKVSFQSLFIFTRFSFCSFGQNSTCWFWIFLWQN